MVKEYVSGVRELSVYVPPSNVLSDEGREMIVKEFPEIRTIASNYFVRRYGIYTGVCRLQKMELWNSPVLFQVL